MDVSSFGAVLGGCDFYAIGRARRCVKHLLGLQPRDPAIAIEAEHERVGDDVAAEHTLHRAAIGLKCTRLRDQHGALRDREVADLEVGHDRVEHRMRRVALVDLA